MNDELSLIDSNLLSHVFDESEPDKKKVCNWLLNDGRENGNMASTRKMDL